LKIFAKVKPNSKKEGVKQIDSAHFEIRVKAPPAEGKANAAAINSLARHLNVPKTRIKIAAGAKSKQKVFEIL
jgi:hypothetical protein